MGRSSIRGCLDGFIDAGFLSAKVLALRARASYGSGNIAGAVRLYEEVMRRDPDNSEVARGLKKMRSLTRQCASPHDPNRALY